MATNYPGGLDSFTAPAGDDALGSTTGGRKHSERHRDIEDAVEAIQAELGVNPAGDFDTVAEHLDNKLDLGVQYVTNTATPLVNITSGGSAAILHLMAGAAFTGPYLVGIGPDCDGANGVTISCKANNNVGLAVNLSNTTGSGSKGINATSAGPGQCVVVSKASSAAGILLGVYDFGQGGTGKLFGWGTSQGALRGYIDSDSSLVVQSAAASQNLVKFAPESSGAVQSFYHWQSGSLYRASAIYTSGTSLIIGQATANAAVGSESLTAAIEVKDGSKLGFFAATPAAKPSVSGSRGGNAALASLITALATLGLVTDSSS